MTELQWLSVEEATRAIAIRKLSPIELTAALLERIGQLDPKLNVFVRLDGDAAMNVARAAEAEIAAGRRRGPLQGVPVGIKDIIDVAGLPTTCHSRILIDNVATADALRGCAASARLCLASSRPTNSQSAAPASSRSSLLHWVKVCQDDAARSRCTAGDAAGLHNLLPAYILFDPQTPSPCYLNGSDVCFGVSPTNGSAGAFDAPDG